MSLSRFLRELFCFHYWVDESFGYRWTRWYEWPPIGLKHFEKDFSVWGCKNCGKKKRFSAGFIPLNYEGH